MPGEHARRKGAGGERELAALLPNAIKISRSYQPGADVVWMGYNIEVKRRSNGFKTDYKWLQDAPIVAKRADRKPWLVVLELDTLLDLMDHAALREH